MTFTITPLGVLALRVWLEGEGKGEKMDYWVFVKGEDTPRNVTPLSCGSAQWYADTLAIELGTEARVFGHGRKASLGRLVSTHTPHQAQRQAVKDSLRGMEGQP